MLRDPSLVVSVIVINFRGADDTIECVLALSEVDWSLDRLDVIVVDNGSGDDSVPRLRAAFADLAHVRLVESAENTGFTGGCNLGVRHARGALVAFLNNDAVPDRRWIRAALEQFDVSATVAAVGSKVLDWEGTAIDFVASGMSWFGMGYKEHVTEADDGRFDRDGDLLFGTGSALFVRRDVFEEVGGFDEKLFMFYDDVDLGWRLNLLGYRVRLAADSIVRHRHHGSMSSFGSHRETYLLERNALIMLYKNLSDENLGRFLPAALGLVARRAASRAGMDPESFDLRRFTGGDDEHEPRIEVGKEAVSGLFAMDRFVALLPELERDRARIQSHRVRTDTEVLRRATDIFRQLFSDPAIVEGQRDVESAFGIRDAVARRRVVVITGDSIGMKMAGPAMRAWKISEALSLQSDVRLVTWNTANRSAEGFEVHRVRLHNEREMAVHEDWADVIIFQGHAMHHFETIRRSSKVMVVDLYDPMHLEQLEQGREWGTPQWRAQVESATEVLNQQLLRGDFFLCASERQRLFWLGQLAALGRINPDNYAADENMGGLISIVPFGMDAADPVHERNAIRGVTPGIGADDKVVIWGGGIYNWFDTVTLVRAIGKVATKRPDVRLFFLGVAHPNPDVPEMAIVSRTRELSDRLGLTGKHVFFNEQWVALTDRQNYLLEADLGVSTHYDHVETTLSFRTRILDYLWARLPIVTTRGDSFGDLVASEGMGVAVAERDVDALASALDRMLYDRKAIDRARAAVDRVRGDFTWDTVLTPLIEFCHDPQPAPDRALSMRDDARRGGSGSRSAPRAARSPEQVAQEFHEIGIRPRGVARDVALARHYLRHGGVSLLVAKLGSRATGRNRDT